MKSSFRLAWLMVGVALAISRLAAQDVIVTNPAWLDPEMPAADQLPTFKKSPEPKVPEALKKSDQVEYAFVWETIDGDGRRLASNRAYTNPALEIATNSVAGAIKYTPAKRAGKNAMVTCWFSIIYNPASAGSAEKSAMPRVLAVAPVVVAEDDLPPGTELPLVVWATLSISQKGTLQNFAFEDPRYETLRAQTATALHHWKFAPARPEGLPVLADVRVPLIVNKKFWPSSPGIPPKLIHKVDPTYPFAMLHTGLRGEVLVEFVVDRTGKVKDPVIVKTNNPGFNETAIEALLEWKFEPGRMGGEPVNARMQQPFAFDITDGEGRDLMSVKPTKKKAQEGLPAELKYDEPPKTKALVNPVFPFPLLQAEKYGKAKVAFLIDARGKVIGVNVLNSSSPEFGLALTAALEAYEFYPASKDGKPTASILNMEKEFSHDMIDAEDLRLMKLETKHPEKIITPKKLDTPLRPIHRSGTPFPSAVLDSQTSGKAMIEALIDEEGKVRLPRIVEATDPAFGYTAVQSLAAWRFEPPKVNGKPVVVRVRVPFEFTIETASPETPATPSKGS